MTRDFSKDLTILVAGSGNATMQHLEESLADWIFGSVDEREVHVILPVLANMGGAIRNLIKLGVEWEFKFTVIQAKNAAMTRELSALPKECFIREDTERGALEIGLGMLGKAHKELGNETALLLAYNPESTYEQGNPTLSDYEIIGKAKTYTGLSTLNLCEGLIDSFEGFKTTEELQREEQLKREFEDKQRAEEAAKPKPEKKAPVPRKRAAKKVEPQESKPLVTEPEKPLEDVPMGTVVEVAGTEFVKVGPNPFRAPLPTARISPVESAPNSISTDNLELSADILITDIAPSDIQEDIREAQAKIEKTHTIIVSKVDLAQLSSDIKELTTAFGNIMDTFTRILKDG